MEKELLSETQAAKYLEISEEKLKELVEKEIIPAYKIGDLYLRFKKDQLKNLKLQLSRSKLSYTVLEKIKDFFYFNDFYLISFLIISILLWVSLRQ